MDLFSNQAGAVVAVPSPGIPMSMYLQGWNGYAPMKSIITGLAVQTKSGVLFAHSLKDFINIYVFGERIAPVTISGVSFAHVCERYDETIHNPFTGQISFLPNYHGLEYVMSYYNSFRVSTYGAPVTIVLGLSTVLFGFLTGCDTTLQDANTRVSQFSLAFQSVPQVNILELLSNQAVPSTGGSSGGSGGGGGGGDGGGGF